MKASVSNVACLTLAATLLCACSGLPERDAPSSRAHRLPAERQILLTVRQPRTTALGLTGATNKRYLRRRAYGPTPSVERTLNQLAREHGLERIDGWPIGSLEVYCEVLAVPEGVAIDDVLARLAADPRVDIAQRMNTFETLGSRYDDPYAELQQAVVQLEIEPAHNFATGKGVTIALIDSAVEIGHPDLRGRVGVAYDLVAGRSSLKISEIHGTAVAGVIASAVDNAEGIVGVAPGVRIAALRACWSIERDGTAARCSTFSLAQALEVALDIEPQIINLSLTGPDDLLLSRLLDQAIERGIVVVAAKPETVPRRSSFPASHERVIVADSASSDLDLDTPYVLAAPANEILTTAPNASYAFVSGNSLAAAHISGVIALLMEWDDGMDVERIVRLLADTTQRSPGLTSISACRALGRLINLEVCGPRVETARF
jgi:hypothetical protein